MVKIEDKVFRQLGGILYDRLAEAMFNDQDAKIDISTRSESEQKLIFGGIEDKLEEAIPIKIRRNWTSYDSAQVLDFRLLSSLYTAGVNIPINLLEYSPRDPDSNDRMDLGWSDRFYNHLRWVESVADDSSKDTDEAYDENLHLHLDEGSRQERRENGHVNNRPFVFKTSDSFRKSFRDIKDANLLDRVISRGLSKADEKIEEEKSDRYRSPSQDTVLDILKDICRVEALHRGRNTFNLSSLDDLSFFDRIVPGKSEFWKRELAFRQASDSSYSKSSDLLYSISMSADDYEFYGAKLLDNYVNFPDVPKLLNVVKAFFDKATVLRRESGEKGWAQRHSDNYLRLADEAVKKSGLELARKLYMEFGFISEDDANGFNRHLLRVSDRFLDEIESTHNVDWKLSAMVEIIYRQVYPELLSMPNELADRFLPVSSGLGKEGRETFFREVYGDELPAHVALELAKSYFGSGELEKAEVLYLMAGQPITAEMLVEQGKDRLCYQKEVALQYLRKAVSLGHRKLTFREYFVASVSDFKLDQDKVELKSESLAMIDFLDVLDLDTDKYDYSVPTDLESAPETYTELPLRYVLVELKANDIVRSYDFPGTILSKNDKSSSEDRLNVFLPLCRASTLHISFKISKTVSCLT